MHRPNYNLLEINSKLNKPDKGDRPDDLTRIDDRSANVNIHADTLTSADMGDDSMYSKNKDIQKGSIPMETSDDNESAENPNLPRNAAMRSIVSQHNEGNTTLDQGEISQSRTDEATINRDTDQTNVPTRESQGAERQSEERQESSDMREEERPTEEKEDRPTEEKEERPIEEIRQGEYNVSKENQQGETQDQRENIDPNQQLKEEEGEGKQIQNQKEETGKREEEGKTKGKKGKGGMTQTEKKGRGRKSTKASEENVDVELKGARVRTRSQDRSPTGRRSRKVNEDEYAKYASMLTQKTRRKKAK